MERRRGHQEAWEIGKKSLIIIVTGTLRPPGVPVGLYWPWASAGWHAATPAIHPSPSHSSYTHIQTLCPPIVIFFLSADGITVMPSSSELSISALPTSPVTLVKAKGSGVSSFPFWSIWSNHCLKGTFLQLRGRRALKLWYASETKASWMIDVWMLTHAPRERTQSFDPKCNKV